LQVLTLLVKESGVLLDAALAASKESKAAGTPLSLSACSMWSHFDGLRICTLFVLADSLSVFATLRRSVVATSLPASLVMRSLLKPGLGPLQQQLMELRAKFAAVAAAAPKPVTAAAAAAVAASASADGKTETKGEDGKESKKKFDLPKAKGYVPPGFMMDEIDGEY
jgi:hypothetical protein